METNFFNWIETIDFQMKYHIYSLSKCNNKELYPLQMSLNDSKSASDIYFKKLMPHHVTIDTNLHIFQYKILHNFSYLNKSKMFLHLIFLYVIRKMKPLYTFFTLAIKGNLFHLNSKSY